MVTFLIHKRKGNQLLHFEFYSALVNNNSLFPKQCIITFKKSHCLAGFCWFSYSPSDTKVAATNHTQRRNYHNYIQQDSSAINKYRLDSAQSPSIHAEIALFLSYTEFRVLRKLFSPLFFFSTWRSSLKSGFTIGSRTGTEPPVTSQPQCRHGQKWSQPGNSSWYYTLLWFPYWCLIRNAKGSFASVKAECKSKHLFEVICLL